jgi:LEA14-like dessication related protein
MFLIRWPRRRMALTTPLAWLLLAAVLTGCTALGLLARVTLEKPKFHYQDHRLGPATRTQTHLVVTLAAENPNAIGLKNVFVNYELSTQGRRFMTGQDVQVTLAPQGTTLIEVPADIVYSDLLAVLGPTAKSLLQGQSTVPIDVHLMVRGEPTLYDGHQAAGLFAFSFTTDRSVNVPVPRLEDLLGKAKDQLKSWLTR